MNSSSAPKRRVIFDVPIDAMTMNGVLEDCRNAILSRSRYLIGMVNAAKIVRMRRQPLLRQSIIESDVVLADGMAVVWASRLLGHPLPERVAGIDLFEQLLQLCSREGYSVFFLGATADVLDHMVDSIRVRWPALRIAGMQEGYFSEDESQHVAEVIAKSKPDILFVGITSPKKEVFIARYGERINVPVCHGVGGSFDIFAGITRRAPLIWQRCGMEWLYRVCQEPGRMWKRYLVTNTVFIALLIREIYRGLLSRNVTRHAPPSA